MTRVVVLAVAVFVVLPAAPVWASEHRPTLQELEHEVMCPTCKQLLELSHAPVAERIRAFIRSRIAAGDTKSEIKRRLVDEFGEAVLAAPPAHGFDLLAWLLPLAGLMVSGAAIGIAARHWVRGPDGAAGDDGTEPVDGELARRLDAELAIFDS